MGLLKSSSPFATATLLRLPSYYTSQVFYTMIMMTNSKFIASLCLATVCLLPAANAGKVVLIVGATRENSPFAHLHGQKGTLDCPKDAVSNIRHLIVSNTSKMKTISAYGNGGITI